MDFTREPIVETVITPREGFRLVVRSSKNPGHEEHFVDALEVITFGSHCFYRNIERPKTFLLPVSDYEVLEAREAKIVLKSPSIEGAVKIGGGRAESKNSESRHSEARTYPSGRESREREGRELSTDKRDTERRDTERRDTERRESVREAVRETVPQETVAVDSNMPQEAAAAGDAPAENGRVDRRRDRRRGVRSKTRRGPREAERESALADDSEILQDEAALESPLSDLEAPQLAVQSANRSTGKTASRESPNSSQMQEGMQSGIQAPPSLSTILPPPTTLIRDDIARLKANELYKGAFYIREELEAETADDEQIAPFVAMPEESEEDSFEDYRAKPEPSPKLSETNVPSGNADS